MESPGVCGGGRAAARDDNVSIPVLSAAADCVEKNINTTRQPNVLASQAEIQSYNVGRHSESAWE